MTDIYSKETGEYVAYCTAVSAVRRPHGGKGPFSAPPTYNEKTNSINEGYLPSPLANGVLAGSLVLGVGSMYMMDWRLGAVSVVMFFLSCFLRTKGA